MTVVEYSAPPWIPAGESGMAAIVFTDVVNSTGIMTASAKQTSATSDQTITYMQRDKALMRAICQASGGCVVKSTGDGLMLCFQSAKQAVSCVRDIQVALQEQARSLPPTERLLHRLGVHSGDVTRTADDNDIMGPAVNITARLQGEAPPGGVCISRTVYDSVHNALALPFVDGGLKDLKGVEVQMRVFYLLSPQRIFLSYRTIEPDVTIAQQFHDALEEQGHYAFMAQKDLQLGEAWPQRLEQELQLSDYVLVLLSEKSVSSEMVIAELEKALRFQEIQGSPKLLPIRVQFPLNSDLNYSLRGCLDQIQQREWRSPQDTPKLIEEVQKIVMSLGNFVPERPRVLTSLPKPSLPTPFADMPVLEIPAGTMDPQSQFYVPRHCDTIALETIQQQGVTITIKGPRQVGKSSLLSRTNAAAIEAGKRVAFLDFQLFDKSALGDADRFFYQFCAWLTDVLELEDKLDEYWSPMLGNSQRCTRYMGRHLLKALGMPLVLSMDEVERVFDTEFRSDFFSMLRSWHNSRANMPVWKQFDLVLVTSTEPYQLIDNLHQSPFNVGQILDLDDFSLAQVSHLNEQHGNPLTEEKVTELMTLLGGHPFLTRKALYMVASQQISIAELFAKATDDQGPFGDHLRYHLFRLGTKPEQKQGLLEVIQNQVCSDDDIYFRLRGAGLISSREGTKVRTRCELYARYFQNRLQG
ncbi:MAG: AAA-like domain-containing protein [Prochlorotrichaceae cyanobacterium]